MRIPESLPLWGKSKLPATTKPAAALVMTSLLVVPEAAAPAMHTPHASSTATSPFNRASDSNPRTPTDTAPQVAVEYVSSWPTKRQARTKCAEATPVQKSAIEFRSNVSMSACVTFETTESITQMKEMMKHAAVTIQKVSMAVAALPWLLLTHRKAAQGSIPHIAPTITLAPS
eukprot:CAMPEP_0206262512 /NCGR_PEP_ID=MMETSP0047_2-20121206/28281_1 /ASSEMBLY_ACC=CAM_ASM_000192 /TAXON_ID=195065 /ORGANISM="Chroomonas mesostigmatica_cf, Strain CCMP1168" /LENGTH=172 /DNA_ID=CAMNT_0053689905 /DNA_START=284 /DNA_END=799 /DNA_ORIENTATION=+